MPEFWQTLSPSIIGLLAAGCFAAYFLKGFSGFGPALILIPTLTLIFGPSFALAGSAFVDLWVGLALLTTLRFNRRELAIALRMVAAIAAGTLPGALLAGKAPRAVVLLAIGVSVVAMGLRWIISRSSSPGAGGSVPAAGRRIWAGCALGGFTGGLVGISAPFVVAGAASLLDKTTLRRVLVAVFLAEGIIKLAIYRAVSVWDGNVPALALLISPAVAAGLVAGSRAHFAVSERTFSRVVGALLLALGIRILISV